MDIKLKPCPFCGGEAELIHGTSYNEDYSSQVRCPKCGVKIKEVYRAVDYCADEKAAEAWNKRTPIRDINGAQIIDPMDGYVKIKLRGKNGLDCVSGGYFEGAEYVCIDVLEKIDTEKYGAYWYEEADE